MAVHRRDFLKTSVLGLSGLYLSGGLVRGASADRPPDIVMMVADDMGWDDVGYHGSTIQTPNIDRLASEGVELDQFYACPVCSPTRAGLMTGRYPIRSGMMRSVITPWNAYGLPVEETTLPEALASLGYENRGCFGKWHLGHADIKYHPLRRGFTKFYGHYNGALDYFTHKREGVRDWHENYTPSDDRGYATDLISRAAAEFIMDNKDADRPVFTYVPFNSPHTPLQAPEEYIAMYEHLQEGEEPSRRQIYAAMVTNLDDGIGRVLDAVDRSGKRENTIVLFMSDNGGTGHAGENTPLRGAKGSVFEGGIRVPAAIRWPAGLPQGIKCSDRMAYIDVFPTLIHLAGGEIPEGLSLDGIDVSDYIRGKRSGLRRTLFSYIGLNGEDREQIAVSTPEWKLICRGRNVADPDLDPAALDRFLFRIAEDPNEEHNLIAEQEELAESLFSVLRWFRGLQPRGGVTPFNVGRKGFTPPDFWIMPGSPAENPVD